MANKSNKVEFIMMKREMKDRIIDETLTWRTFCDICKEKYNIGKDQATKVWKLCWEDIDKQVEKHDLIKVTQLINNLNELSNDDNKHIRLKAIEQLRKIGGLDATEKQEVTHKGDIKLSWGSPS